MWEKKIIPKLGLILLCNSCTCSLNVVNTEGTASDVIDETQSNKPDVSPDIDLKIPAT